MSECGSQRGSSRRDRRQRYKKGRWAEIIAAALLLAKGYRLIEWRARGPVAEIDLIARRGRRLAFVEVKYRRSITEAQAAIAPRQQQRLIGEAEYWVAQRPQYHGHEIGMDAILVCPWHWPRHEQNVFYDVPGAVR